MLNFLLHIALYIYLFLCVCVCVCVCVYVCTEILYVLKFSFFGNIAFIFSSVNFQNYVLY